MLFNAQLCVQSIDAFMFDGGASSFQQWRCTVSTLRCIAGMELLQQFAGTSVQLLIFTYATKQAGLVFQR